MSDKKTKSELMAMLAEAVRNTQPQPVLAPQPELIRDTRDSRKNAAMPTAKSKTARRSARRKPSRR